MLSKCQSASFLSPGRNFASMLSRFAFWHSSAIPPVPLRQSEILIEGLGENKSVEGMMYTSVKCTVHEAYQTYKFNGIYGSERERERGDSLRNTGSVKNLIK